MSYIGNQPSQAAFLTDTFSGNGTTTAFTMSVAPANTASVLVAVTGVVQDPSTYSVVGTTLTFTGAPPTGTGNISCRYLGIPASGVTTTAYRTVTEFTSTAGQTTFTPPSYTVGFINVYRNGVRLGAADYTATNGTTVVLTNAATSGDLVTIESFLVSSVLNAIPATAGSVGTTYLTDGGTTPAKLSTGGLYWDTSGNVGIGTSSPNAKLYVASAATQAIVVGQGTIGTDYGIGRDNSNGALTFYGNQTGAVSYIFSGVNGERARIDTSGGLRINNTGPLEYAGNTELLTVNGTSGNAAAFRAAGNTYPTLVVRQDYGSGTQTYLYFKYNGTNTGSITSSGTTTVYNTSSDYRLKDVAGRLEGYKERLIALRPKQGSWKIDGSEFRGFLAHEFAESYPASVSGQKDAVDAEGNPQYQGMQAGSSEVIADLVAMVQEQQALITQLQADVAALKGAK